MKRILLLGSLLLGLTACGGGGGTVTPEPDTSYPYNPNASAVQSSDARIPYRGDWVFAAILADGGERSGVVGITTKYSDDNLKNAGGGFMAWCYKAGCSPDDEQGTGLIGSVKTSAGAALSIGMVPEKSNTVRFVMIDDDGLVGTTEGRATISGQGLWTSTEGVDQAAVFAFVQVNYESKLGTQQAKAQALLTAQGLLNGRRLGAQQTVSGAARAALERALTK